MISIIMPTYNSESYIQESIFSVLNQTYNDYELIIIDDGSTDSTKSIVESIQDPRIKYIYINNSGVSAARNKGIELSSNDSDYIAFLDSDDLWHPEKLELQINLFINNDNLVICGTYCNIISEDGIFLYSDISLPVENFQIRKNIIIKNPFITSSVIVKRNIIIKNDIKFDIKRVSFEEIIFWNKILKYGEAQNINYQLLDYRVRPSGLSQLNIDRPTQKDLLFNDKITIRNNKIIDNNNTIMIKYYYKIIFMSIYRGGNVDVAIKLLSNGIKYSPYLFKFYQILISMVPQSITRMAITVLYNIWKFLRITLNSRIMIMYKKR